MAEANVGEVVSSSVRPLALRGGGGRGPPGVLLVDVPGRGRCGVETSDRVVLMLSL